MKFSLIVCASMAAVGLALPNPVSYWNLPEGIGGSSDLAKLQANPNTGIGGPFDDGPGTPSPPKPGQTPTSANLPKGFGLNQPTRPKDADNKIEDNAGDISDKPWN
ncbi:hypothetical protein HIM_09332 [Hirsutella minnesotensis 3608]|uniref:Uncharacterized protein n=1 Tax=Hirsutella minnesotensis 3608 TaxID=1043627 RepID=A0A0F8A359_9HYPO|nr:hypothetical protein HIM_09332 [Hirsutella minnesotensis 3608]